MQPNGPLQISGFTASAQAVTVFTLDGTPVVLDANSYRTTDILDSIIEKMGELRAKGEKTAPIVELDISQFSLAKKIRENSAGAIRVDFQNETPTAIQVAGVKITTGVEKLAQHIELASQSSHSALALENFIKLFSKVQQSRKHTAEELLTFIKNNDLPIAADGRIIAFKILRKTPRDGVSFPADYVYDKHSGSVPQRVGSLVMMPANAVNESRRHSCSTGFHVCSVRYWQGFWSSGDPIVITLVDPADIIAVPVGEPTKMRACAYFIAASVDEKLAAAIHSARMHTHLPEVQALVAEIAAGNHAPVIETVFQAADGSVSITPSEEAGADVKKKLKRIKTSKREPAERRRPQPMIDAKSLQSKLDDALEGKQTLPRTRKITLAKQLMETRGLSIKAVARELRMSDSWLGKALAAEGWSPNKATPATDAHLQSTIAAKIAIAEKLLGEGKSVREASRISGVPRSTLQDHLKRKPAPSVAIEEKPSIPSVGVPAKDMSREDRIAAALALVTGEKWSVKRAAKHYGLSDSRLGKLLKQK